MGEAVKLRRHLLLIAVAYTLAMVFIGFAAGRASAQDGRHGAGHAEHHDAYKGLVNPATGASCCNGTVNGVEGDCRPGAVWRDAGGDLRARIGGQVYHVPESALVPSEVNPHPPVGMICEKDRHFYCVALSGAGG